MQRLIFSIVGLLVIGFALWWFVFRDKGPDEITEGTEVAIAQDVTNVQKAEDEAWDNEVGVIKPNLEGFGISIKNDRLDIVSPVVNGTTLDILAEGVGHHVSTAYPNDKTGNVVLSGHRWYPGAETNPNLNVFEDLDQLAIGDEVVVAYDGADYVYRVREEKIVEPTATEILAPTENPQLTLYTCTPKKTAEKRLVYIADFVEVRPHTGANFDIKVSTVAEFAAERYPSDTKKQGVLHNFAKEMNFIIAQDDPENVSIDLFDEALRCMQEHGEPTDATSIEEIVLNTPSKQRIYQNFTAYASGRLFELEAQKAPSGACDFPLSE